MKNMKTTKSLLIILLVLIMTGGAMLAMAADPEAAAPEKAAKADPNDQTEAQVGRSTVPDLKVNQAEMDAQGDRGLETKVEPQLRPMTMEINAVLEQSRLQVSTLQDRFDNEPNAEAAVVIVRQMEKVKINAELDILRVQVRYARTAGNEELAQKIEASLTKMTTPAPRREPVDRPAPDAGNR